MPIRAIPKNHLVVTGRHATSRVEGGSADFESTLEKEHMLLLDFDPRVVSYQPQPFRLPLSGGRSYVPDLLVNYDADLSDDPITCELVEVKAQADLDKHAEDYREKFEAADAYCEERGWRFVIRTEHDIRTPRLQAVKFLKRYRNLEADPEREAQLLEAITRTGGRCTVTALLEAMASSLEDRVHFAAPLWRLVAVRHIQIDLDAMIQPDSVVWLED